MAHKAQACERQEECRNAADDLISHFHRFLPAKDHFANLKENEESKYAMEDILGVITEGTTFVIENTERGFFRACYHLFRHDL